MTEPLSQEEKDRRRADRAAAAEARSQKRKSPDPDRDSAPKSKGAGGATAANRRAKLGAELGRIEQGFGELLAMPAMPFAMSGDRWAADHFANRGPALAKRLAAECERNPQLRKWCLRALEGQSIAMLGVELFMYAGLPLMHFGIVPGAEQFGVPVVKRKARAATPPPEANGSAPYIRFPDGRIERRDRQPLTAEDEAIIAAEFGLQPDPDQGEELEPEEAPPIEPI